MAVQKVEPAITLDVEDQVEFTLVLVGQEVTALDSGGVQQHIDAAATLAHLVDDAGHAVRIGEVDAEVVRRAACRAHCVDGALRCLCPLQRRQFLFHQRRSGALAARFDALEQIALESVFVAHEASEVRIVGIGFRNQIQQVERAARCGSQVGSDGRHDTSRRAGDQKDAVLVERQTVLAPGEGLFLQSHCPTQAILVANFDCAVVAQGLLEHDDGNFRRTSSGLEIDRLDVNFRTLALVGLGEADNRSAQRGNGSGDVVAVLSAKLRGRDQERTRRRDLLVQSAHRGVQRLDAHPQSFMPSRQIHVAEVAFVVERGQPVHSLDRTRRQPLLAGAPSGRSHRAWRRVPGLPRRVSASVVSVHWQRLLGRA